MPKENKKQIAFIRELMKLKTEEEIIEAEENFREYLLIVKEICDRIESETESQNNIDSDNNYEIV
jgi:hypothetical protein